MQSRPRWIYRRYVQNPHSELRVPPFEHLALSDTAVSVIAIVA